MTDGEKGRSRRVEKAQQKMTPNREREEEKREKTFYAQKSLGTVERRKTQWTEKSISSNCAFLFTHMLVLFICDARRVLVQSGVPPTVCSARTPVMHGFGLTVVVGGGAPSGLGVGGGRAAPILTTLAQHTLYSQRKNILPILCLHGN